MFYFIILSYHFKRRIIQKWLSIRNCKTSFLDSLTRLSHLDWHLVLNGAIYKSIFTSRSGYNKISVQLRGRTKLTANNQLDTPFTVCLVQACIINKQNIINIIVKTKVIPKSGLGTLSIATPNEIIQNIVRTQWFQYV